ILLFAFFTAFTALEATLPSLVSKIAPIKNKGAAMGVYSSSQFLGIFVGGAAGGWILSHAHLSGIFAFCAVISLIWITIAFSMAKPPYLSTLVFPMNAHKENNYQALSTLPGVAEIAIVSSENLLYVKIDKQKISEPELRSAINEGNLAEVK
ncbi:MAG TPA: MFS transporter, partial [Gammaproteobacteria bacterium]|nr:MFS transporter [Gammaproteobacteria bacterium]